MATTLETLDSEELKAGQLYKLVEEGHSKDGETILSLTKVEDAPDEKSPKEQEHDLRYGQKYSRLPARSRYGKVTVMRAEIEMPHELYELITSTMLEYSGYPSIDAFITRRFIERMKQIVTDPTEFGKLMLQGYM